MPEEYLPAIREQVGTLTRLVDDLFELAKIDAGAVTLELRDAPLGELIRNCIRAIGAEARLRDIRLAARVESPGPSVHVAPDKVERVLLNLLTNAVRHTPAHGAVSVVVEPDSDHVIVAVEDTSRGLPAHEPNRMFELFWRHDKSRTRSTGGLGLGLAIARGLVHAHGALSAEES